MSVTPSVIISSSVTVSPTSNNAGISSSGVLGNNIHSAIIHNNSYFTVIAAIAVSIIFVLIVGSAVTVVISVILGVHFYKKSKVLHNVILAIFICSVLLYCCIMSDCVNLTITCNQLLYLCN